MFVCIVQNLAIVYLCKSYNVHQAWGRHLYGTMASVYVILLLQAFFTYMNKARSNMSMITLKLSFFLNISTIN